jgi:hypothetical protein
MAFANGALPPPDFQVGNSQFGGQYATPGGASGSAPGSISGIGGYTPDWASLISGDAGLIDAKNALAAGNVSDLAGRNAAIENAYVQFGSNIDFATLAKQLGMSEADVQQALGPDAQKLAQENTSAGLSTQARLDQANTNAIQKIRADLNRRGILNNGEAGYQLDQQNLGYRQAESDATQKLLSYLQQYQQGYLSAQQQRQGQLATAYGDAANRQYGTNAGSPGVTATFDHVDASGNAVYRAADGSLYHVDGSPYSAPVPSGGTVGPSYAAGVGRGNPNPTYSQLPPSPTNGLIKSILGYV